MPMLSSENSAVATRKPSPQKQRDVRRETKIYFILCPATGRVKCGIASDPRLRLAGLQVGSPTALKLIAEIDGSALKERLIHERLARWHIHGEWFHYVPEVYNIIVDEVASHLKDLYQGIYVERAKLHSVVPPIATGYVAKFDPCGQFIEAHVRSDPGGPGVAARAMFEAYTAWCEMNGIAAMFETRFGLMMKKKLTRDDTGRIHVYIDVALISREVATEAARLETGQN